jgi:leucyl aminopeptidase
MIRLEQYEEVQAQSTLVIVSDKKTKLDKTLGEDIIVYHKKFQKSEDKFDFLKGVNGFTFFVKSEQKSEELRVVGAKIIGHLSKEIKSVSLIGSVSDQLNIAEGMLLSSYQFIKYFKDADKKKLGLETVLLSKEVSSKKINELLDTAKAVFWARDRVNEPVSHLNASQLAEAISELGTEAGMTVQVLEKTQIESLKMGGLLAVNKGSIDQPTFTIVEYKPEKAINKKPIVLVGKGVVYDTGGLSLKPTPGSMDVMKSDMAGAACMAGTIYLAALQKLKVHLIALIPATDNRPGLNAYAPGDVITMYDGTTVEVLNSDAEGRMILADALAYSNKFKPELVIDAATLTGAALRAIGTKASVIMGNADDKVFEQLEKAGNEVHERTVRFPFWDDYATEIKSSIADLKNLGGPNAGMITAGKFLEHFVKSPYIHMDIAGPAWLDAKEDYKGQGGTGAGIRMLFNFLKKYK